MPLKTQLRLHNFQKILIKSPNKKQLILHYPAIETIQKIC